MIKYKVTNKETNINSIVEFKEDSYFEVLASDEGGLTVGNTYPKDVFQLLMVKFYMSSVEG